MGGGCPIDEKEKKGKREERGERIEEGRKKIVGLMCHVDIM